MRDFPIFTTQYGVSSLQLREIPYRAAAYILVRDVCGGKLQEHLRECADFCRAAGAEKIFASGHDGLDIFPLHSAVYRMRGTGWVDQEKLARLFPVTEATAPHWRTLYNARMAGVDHAHTLEVREERVLAEKTGVYFVHRDGAVLGIGWLDGNQLLAMAATQPGAGETVMHTLMSLAEGEQMTLEVVSTNTWAIDLYERLGFCKTAIVRKWHQVELGVKY